MSYDLCEFEGCFLTNPFSPLSDSSSIDILKPFQENNYNLTPLSPTFTHNILDIPYYEIDQITPTTTTTTLLSSSPPIHHLESLSLYQMGNSVNSIDVCPIEVKEEQSQLPFYDNYVINNSLLSHSYDGCDNRVKMMQRSFSSKSFDEGPNGYLFKPKFDSLVESPNNDSHMRRVCSTGDLHNLKRNQSSKTLSTSPLATEGSSMEEANFKVGRYSPEERKEKILRYKAKRNQRNFNKTIKYTCRKTLADNRPRIRGRFIRSDESVETPKTLTFQRYGDEDEDELWMDGLQEEYVEGIPRGPFVNTTQFHRFSNFSEYK